MAAIPAIGGTVVAAKKDLVIPAYDATSNATELNLMTVQFSEHSLVGSYNEHCFQTTFKGTDR